MTDRDQTPAQVRYPAEPLSGRDRRIMGLALEHWEEQRQASGLAAPSLDAICLDHPVLRPYFYVVRLAAQISDSIVIHCGGALSALCEKDVLGRELRHCLPREIAAERLDYLAAVAKMGRPMAESGQVDLPKGRVAYFREALMPLRSDGEDALVLGALSCRIALRTGAAF